VTGDQWALALRGALVVVLLVTLLRPTLPRWVDRLNVVFLLDHSDSVSLVARERPTGSSPRPCAISRAATATR